VTARGCVAKRMRVGQWIAIGVGFGLVLAGPVRAKRAPTPGVLDARVRSVPYEADQAVRLQTELLKERAGLPPRIVKAQGDRVAILVARNVDFRAAHRSVARGE
jgi:hypothetical protein